MNAAVRLRESNGRVRQFSVNDAVAEASRDLQRGDTARALRLLDQAVQRVPHVPAVRYLLGVAQLRHNHRDLAIANLERAVQGENNNVDYLAALGEALMAEQPAAAIAQFVSAIELGARRPDVYSLLAAILIDMRKPDDALAICNLGLAMCGEAAEILGNRGVALKELARYEEALQTLKKTEALLPSDYRVLVSLGNVLNDLGNHAEALDYFAKACALRPNEAVAHYNRALALLVSGDLKEGFREYEWRWGSRQFAAHRPEFVQPVWDGSDLEGRHILLTCEQGAGDTLQFARYAQIVKDRGGRVIMHVQRPLVRLMSWIMYDVAVTDRTPSEFEVYCPLGSLAHKAQTDLNSIPPPARFEVPALLRWSWHARLGERKGTRIGMVWAGAAGHLNDRNRSLPLHRMAELLTVPETEWFSFQVGPPAAQLLEAGLQSHIHDLSPALADYAETAAAILQMDLIVTVDTSVAHLAGTLGVPVWVMLPCAPDWRWMLDRDDSPWYPSMKLYRQRTAGDWETVLNTIKTDLTSWLSK